MSNFRIAVLASGSGSLFQALIDNKETHQADIIFLIVDRECQALVRAKEANISAEVVALTSDRASWDRELADRLVEVNADLIVSAGFMRILGPEVLRKFEGKIINTHPALLPNFPGAHAVKDALAAKVPVTGSTIHFVDGGIDTGQVIRQQPVEIKPEESEATLHERIKVIERELLVEVISDFVSGKIKTKARS